MNRTASVPEARARQTATETAVETVAETAANRSALLEAIQKVQTRYIEDADASEAFDHLLQCLLELTRSEYGFIGEVLRKEDGAPYLKTLAITNIAWNDAMRAFYDESAPHGLEFLNLETLFGAVLKTGEPVISNYPAQDPRAGGTPVGHPPLNAFLGLPIYFNNEFNGMIGIANRPGGYDEELIRFLQPFSATCSTLMRAYVNARQAHDAQEERDRIRRQMLLNQNYESLGVLAGGIAHDFNNLLLGVMGNASLLKDSVAGNERDEALLADILKASERAADLCSQMLAYAGKGRFQISQVDLNETARGTLNLIESSAPKSITVSSELEPDLPMVEADQRQLRQILMNLLLNAVESIEDDGTVTLRTGLRDFTVGELRSMVQGRMVSPGEHVFCEVQDTGRGIAPEVREKIFDPFFSTKFTGRGMGLAAVQGIVRSHGGALSFESQPGKGTIFRVILPVADKPEEDEDVQDTPHPVTGWGFPGKVLVADDEDGVRAFLERVLDEAGASAIFASNGSEAVELFRRYQDEIAVVLVDLMMPRMDGVETIRRLRSIDPKVAAILTSGFSEDDLEERYPGHPPAEFLHKPYSAEELVTKLLQVLGET